MCRPADHIKQTADAATTALATPALPKRRKLLVPSSSKDLKNQTPAPTRSNGAAAKKPESDGLKHFKKPAPVLSTCDHGPQEPQHGEVHTKVYACPPGRLGKH